MNYTPTLARLVENIRITHALGVVPRGDCKVHVEYILTAKRHGKGTLVRLVCPL